MKIFDQNIISNRRSRLKQAFDAVLDNKSLVLVFSGEAPTKPGGLDQTYPFLPHPEYYWLSGLRRPWGAVAYGKDHGFVDFVQPVSFDERLWEGVEGDVEGINISELESWAKSKGFQQVFMFGAHNNQSVGNIKRADSKKELDLLETFNQVRRVKDEAEIALVKQCASAALKGYEAISKFIRPGITERDIQIEYESTVLRAGADKFPYDNIVGSGTNAAILHAIPTNKVIGDNEFILIDAGADIADYCVDITRVFSSSGQFTKRQQVIYDIVKAAQKKSVSMCQPGMEWHEVHAASARIMAEGLRDLNIMTCSADTALETGAISAFFPHGVGHLVGLRVRDVGGVVNKPVKEYYGARIRVDLQLEKNFLVTVEPGLYFIKNIIENPEKRKQYQDQINWNEVEKWKDIGGVRIEDDILVDSTPHNLTEIVPK